MKTHHTTAAVMFVCLCIVCGLTGCAVVDQKIGLNYARQIDSIVKHSGDVPVAYIESTSFKKNAAGEWIIGSLNNVYGVHQADLLSDRSPGEWIQQAVLHELKQLGYTASPTVLLPASAARGILISDIELLFLINRGNVTTDTKHELRFNISVYHNGSKTKTFSVASRDDRTIPLVASKEDKEKIMLQSLQDAMKQVIADIVVLIDKK